MKSTRKRKKLVIAALFVGFCVVNFSWIHAALAGLSPASDCPASLIQTARHDVAKLYGETHAKPIPVCLTQPILGIDVSHGTTRFMPMVPSIVVLGAEGLNTDVAAHEYAHAELAERTSVLLRTYRVPTWFDEGLAMQLDHRAPYTEAALKGYLADDGVADMRLAALSTPATFYVKGQQGRTNYAFAKCVVGGWLQDAGTDGLDQLIAEIGWTTAFPTDAFRAYEASCLER